MSKILIVEDEPSIAEGLVDLCQFKGYEAVHTDNGEDGYQQAITGNFDLIILDIMLPGMDGFTVCDKVREQDREIPIIILSAKNSDEDIVQGLRLGADDYINKPFSVSQLFARIEAVLRRSVKLSKPEDVLKIGDTVITFREFNGKRGDEEIPFTRKEIEILEFLSRRPNQAVSRGDLLKEVWGYDNADSIDTRTVDIHITKLRKKIEPDPSSPRFLLTVRGEGYQLILKND
jgi:DNA-binding response OmpR family regulator